MAWEWSHTQEAYDAAQEILHTWDREKLVNATVEDEVQKYVALEDSDTSSEAVGAFIAARYEHWNTYIIDSLLYSQEIMAEHVWGIAEENYTCSNGGFELYIDANGFYTIPLP